MSLFNTPNSFNTNGNLIDISVPLVMGIVNITPDSFYKNSRVQSNNKIIKIIEKNLTDGAKIIDIGAYSSRPGAEPVSQQQEWERLKPALEVIRENYPEVIISVDTFRAKIAEKAIEQYKANIVNDISGGDMDCEMYDVVGKYKVPYILMHMKGTPQNMQQNADYENIIQEMITYFAERKQRLIDKGAKDIIIDPGFGFAKTTEHNFQILARLQEFEMLELPMLVGVSRKSMICKVLGTTPEYALNGTTVINTIALQKGAKILRVHDVKEAVETVKLYTKMMNEKL